MDLQAIEAVSLSRGQSESQAQSQSQSQSTAESEAEAETRLKEGEGWLVAACQAHTCSPYVLRLAFAELVNQKSEMWKLSRARKAANIQLHGQYVAPPRGQSDNVNAAEVLARVATMAAARAPQAEQRAGVRQNGDIEFGKRFTYTYDAQGRIAKAEGVLLAGPGTGVTALPKSWTKFWYEFAFGRAAPAAIEAGHIIAGGMGGSNSDLVNFFPQTGTSNRGPYNTMENGAMTVRDRPGLVGNGRSDCTRVSITFTYRGAYPANTVPTSGTYTYERDDGCNLATAKIGPAVHNWVKVDSKAWTNVVPVYRVGQKI